MVIEKVDVRTYDKSGRAAEKVITVREFAGRIAMTIDDKTVECYFDDLKKAWEAVKQPFTSVKFSSMRGKGDI